MISLNFRRKKKERVGESESKREREVGKETQKQNKKKCSNF